jgi:protein-disulfide isomerase
MTQTDAIDLNRHVYGNPVAPTTIIEYGDFECPYCKAAAPKLRKLIDNSDGGVRLIWRNFPLFEQHAYALTAALAAEASGDRFWEMHDILLANQAHLTAADLERYAAEIGAGAVTGEAAQRFKTAIKADYQAGADAGVRGTPTLFIGDRMYTGKLDYESLCSALMQD